ncbi:kelch-like protein 10 [Engystomops pustulosus]|uniref:kelch-like protein 10 n=1 Tax=Engystomops pustulosus TaxID=76066 RepID=UPI003AFAF889
MDSECYNRRCMKRKTCLMAPDAKRSCSQWMSHGFRTKISSMAYNAYNELTLMGMLCDATIRVQGTEFYTHKDILGLCSPYFRALFKNSLGPADRKVYDIPGVTPNTMWSIIEYAYTNTVEVTPDNAMDLFIAADQFNVMGIVHLCSKFILHQIDLENCMDIWRITNTYLCPELRKRTFTFILHHFEELMTTSDKVSDFTVDELRDLIEKDELCVRDEKAVFEAVTKWIDYNPAERQANMTILLPQIRLALINTDYIRNNIMANPYVRNNKGLKKIINTLTSAHYRARPRRPNANFFSFGGSDIPTNTVRYYDTGDNNWTTVTCPEEKPRAHHGTVYLNGFIYVIGGFDGTDYLRSVTRFDPLKKTWQEISFMKHKRGKVSVTVLNNYIYAMGGYDGQETLNSVERYDPVANRWTLISSMNKRRMDAGATTLDGEIYICGGSNGSDCLSTAEKYNPETKKWSYITPMRKRRSGVGVTTYRGKVYAVSGYNGNSFNRTVETYSPIDRTWSWAPHIQKRRRNFGIGVINDYLYVLGGKNLFSINFYNEIYDGTRWYVTENEWPQSIRHCCVVPTLENIREFRDYNSFW